MTIKYAIATTLLATAMATGAQADAIERHPIPDSDFPILQAVTLSDVNLTYLSGTVPLADDDGEFGDTEAQTISVLERIEGNLERLDLDMSDVVKMTVFLVPTEETGRIDFSGFMDGYTTFFGTEDQPNLPTRSVVGVADLANPEWLVEIEVVAATER
ncbi:RidA family protein [Halomonas salipaludis]|uniref:Enamine deaminase RidA (YjgF/YER057c/UK114 family) n=1 Tax=Halomonas salipaludis TaxID=2032625 RepID=A0A2A2EPS5_9GAMM|nr:RidA family protein [Halomonas salipaludis]PAU74550.1 hypothetical protein CK498_22265 [Halomonas salipaludis]